MHSHFGDNTLQSKDANTISTNKTTMKRPVAIFSTSGFESRPSLHIIGGT